MCFSMKEISNSNALRNLELNFITINTLKEEKYMGTTKNQADKPGMNCSTSQLHWFSMASIPNYEKK
jgi:hypothetical protein